jgi:HD-GYP domain-containing protein (c-di-GMP phosphodiesterase class II)
MDLSNLLKGKKAPPPEEPKAAGVPAAPAPPGAPLEPVSISAFGAAAGPPPARYQLHRDVPTLEDMDAARSLLSELVAASRSFLASSAQKRRVDDPLLAPLRSLGVRVLALLKNSPNSLMMYLSRGTADDYLVAKHVNVGVLAARLGLQMGLSDAEVSAVMLGGFVHDVGLAFITRIDLQPRVLPPAEKGALRAHCAASLPALFGDFPEKSVVLECCLEHHERLDGTGYPKGLKGAAISPAGRLLGVAETYEALTHARPYRDRELSSEAMKTVIDQGGHIFDEPVVKALIRSLSIYPPGSYIELNNSTIARVAGVNADLPTRPLLLPVYDAAGRPLAAPHFLDLSTTPLVRILRAVDEGTLQLSDAKEQMLLRSQRWWTT